MDANNSLHVKVGDFLYPDETYNWSSTSRDLVDLSTLVHLINAEVGKEDCVIWLRCRSGVFSLISAWESLHPKHLMVSWAHLLWFGVNIPRYAFIAWLAIWNQL